MRDYYLIMRYEVYNPHSFNVENFKSIKDRCQYHVLFGLKEKSRDLS